MKSILVSSFLINNYLLLKFVQKSSKRKKNNPEIILLSTQTERNRIDSFLANGTTPKFLHLDETVIHRTVSSLIGGVCPQPRDPQPPAFLPPSLISPPLVYFRPSAPFFSAEALAEQRTRSHHDTTRALRTCKASASSYEMSGLNRW